MSIDPRSVEILEGNTTLQKLMIEILIEVGMSPTIGEDAHLLVVDVDSGLPDVEVRIREYEMDKRPVLICGLRHSRELVAAHLPFVERPFSLGTFVIECINLLGIKKEETTAPASLFPEIDEAEDGSLTDEVSITEATDDEFEFDENSSMIMEVAHLGSEVSSIAMLGAKVAGKVHSRKLDTSELRSLRKAEMRVPQIRIPSLNQTMPDSPIAIADNAATGELESLGESSSVPLFNTSEEELALHIQKTAKMLAQSWQRIALTARTEDRSERIERVLRAAIHKGLRGAAEEVQRIPSASGFAGGLDALSLIDVLRTLRDRRLRGRLEIAIGDAAFLLHIEGSYLDAIELLSGDSDLVILEILNQGGTIDPQTYNLLLTRFREASDEFEPLEMYLLTQKIVSASTLFSAQAVRARELCKSMCGMRGGQFAFLEIRPGDGQSWPANPLRIQHDEVLLEILREASFDTGDSQATARTRLLVDPARIASFTTHHLTDLEQAAIQVFRKGETLSNARIQLEQVADRETIDRVIDRLKKLELLRRTTPPESPPGFISTSSNHSEMTVVSSIPEGISATERSELSPTRVGNGFEVGFDESSVEEHNVNRRDTSADDAFEDESDAIEDM